MPFPMLQLLEPIETIKLSIPADGAWCERAHQAIIIQTDQVTLELSFTSLAAMEELINQVKNGGNDADLA